jgi:hypothetical protein
MNGIALSDNPEEPDLIDRIASALPEKVRSDYYREMRHCRSLPENKVASDARQQITMT